MKVLTKFLIVVLLTGVCESRRKPPLQDGVKVEPSEYYPNEKDAIFGLQERYTDEEQHSRSKRDVKVCSAADGCKKEILRLPPGYNFFDIPFPPNSDAGERKVGINVTMKARVESIREIDEVKERQVGNNLRHGNHIGMDGLENIGSSKKHEEEDVKQFIADGKHLEKPGDLITINNPEYLKSIWKPNLYIYNLIDKTQPRLMTDLITLKYDPEGGFIFYLTRVILKLSCPMEFHYYPADTQKCQFLIRGFSYNEKLLNLMWYKTPYLADRDESNFDVQLSDYEFLKLQLREEVYNGLSFHLMLRRKLSFHLVQTYIPSSFFILITWLCFLIPSTMVEARIGISMTTLLTLTAMFASVRETSPISSYVKALDIWMVSCIFSVFLTLFEFAILTWMRHLQNDKKEKARKRAERASRQFNALTGGIELSTMVNNIKADPVANNGNGHHGREEDDEDSNDSFSFYAAVIEKFAFAVFFLIFIVYNGVYWTWLFNSSGYLEWPEVNTTLNVGEDPK